MQPRTVQKVHDTPRVRNPEKRPLAVEAFHRQQGTDCVAEPGLRIEQDPRDDRQCHDRADRRRQRNSVGIDEEPAGGY
ncbi:MAG: hypothetical protein V3T28_05485 [Gemmatimonadales bacterium]